MSQMLTPFNGAYSKLNIDESVFACIGVYVCVWSLKDEFAVLSRRYKNGRHYDALE